MSYALDITDEAAEDLERLIESLPADRRADALNGVETALERLAANPKLAVRQPLGRPLYRFSFRAADVTYHWGATFQYGQEERTIQVTHMFRVAL